MEGIIGNQELGVACPGMKWALSPGFPKKSKKIPGN
jgi:hypothetical protein